MVDLTNLAIPAFLLLMLIELVSYRFLPDEGEQGYAMRDTATSLTMGVGSVAANLGWNAVALATYLTAYELTPLRVVPTWGSWLLIFVLNDLTYYWQHRADHRVRILWASHVNHHSSQRYNLSTALRQTWTGGFFGFVFWLWMPLIGFQPIMIFTMQAISLLYQFWIHTEVVKHIGALEVVMNTPSHHRVHHATNPQYIDRNHAGT